MTTFIDELGLNSDNTRWMDRGRCKGKDAERWHSHDEEDVAYAKSVCRSCPVVSTCKQWGLSREEASGIWGGLTAQDRKAIRAEASQPLCARGHVLAGKNLYGDGRCRTCGFEQQDQRPCKDGVSRVGCVCGRQIAPRYGLIPPHLDLSTDERCAGVGRLVTEETA